MFRLKIFVLYVLICYGVIGKDDFKDYFIHRKKIVDMELSTIFGSKIKLNLEEREANKVLMKYKYQELKLGFQNRETFLPSESFLKVSTQIEHSKVFRIIRKMPKGGILHAHEHAITSRDFILNNITQRPDLYICQSHWEGLKLRFFDETTASARNDCDWESLKEARYRDESIDLEIQKALSMYEKESSKPNKNSITAWRKFLKIFSFIKPLITYRPVYEDFLYHQLEEIYNDNVQFIEIRTPFSNLYELDGYRYNHLQVIKIYKTVVDRFIKDHPFFMGVKWIYSPQRDVDHFTFSQYIRTFRALKKKYPNHVTGFDLVGQEDKGPPLRSFIRELQILGEETDFFFHAGETNWYGQQGDENLIDAILLNTKRIGHGYSLIKHPELIKLVKSKKIALEISPISNQVLNLVQDLRNHPAAYFFAENFPIVVSNDDPSFWGARALSYDFYEAFIGIMSSKADLRALKQLALNSIVHSSMNATEKNSVMEVWLIRWKKFIKEIIRQG